jgi:hypothetical protein
MSQPRPMKHLDKIYDTVVTNRRWERLFTRVLKSISSDSFQTGHDPSFQQSFHNTGIDCE